MFELIELPNGQVFAAGVGKWHLVRGRVGLNNIRVRSTA